MRKNMVLTMLVMATAACGGQTQPNVTINVPAQQPPTIIVQPPTVIVKTTTITVTTTVAVAATPTGSDCGPGTMFTNGLCVPTAVTPPTDTGLIGAVSITRAPDDIETKAGIVIGGATGVVLAKYRFTAQREEFWMRDALFQVATPNAITSISLYDKDVLVGGPIAVNDGVFASFPEITFWVPKDGYHDLTVRGNVNTVGPSGVQTGSNAAVSFVSAALSSNTGVTTQQFVVSGNPKIVRKSRLTVTTVALPQPTLVLGENVAMRLTMSADAAGDVSFKEIRIQLSKTDNPIVNDIGIRRVGDFGNLDATRRWSNSAITVYGSAVSYATIVLTNEETIGAGTSRTYDIRLNVVANTPSTPLTQTDGIASIFSMDDFSGKVQGNVGSDVDLPATESNLVWSDISAVPHYDRPLTTGSDDFFTGQFLYSHWIETNLTRQ